MTINKALFSSAKDNWETPQDLFDKLKQEFNFVLDVCADDNNTKCDNFYDESSNGLEQSWYPNWMKDNEWTWCNPPYSSSKLWIKKAYEEYLKGANIVMLLPSRTDTKAFHDYIYPIAEIRFLKGRLHFSNSKHPAPFPSMIVIFRGDSK